MIRATILDYGVGNLHSLAKALTTAGAEVRVERDPFRALETDSLVLPGVGAFAPAATALSSGRARLRRAIAGGLPTLGICLGMQLLLDSSEEGAGAGLGIFPGGVSRLRARQVPQIGWNRLEEADDPLLAASGLRVAYYANSFVARPDDEGCVRAWSAHESDRFPAVLRVGACVGVQFHPEKSGREGVAFLDAFLRAPRAPGNEATRREEGS